jgi:hypothetical protein
MMLILTNTSPSNNKVTVGLIEHGGRTVIDVSWERTPSKEDMEFIDSAIRTACGPQAYVEYLGKVENEQERQRVIERHLRRNN